jgi:kinesin family member 5
VDQNTALKKEAGIAERKLMARNERIQNLEVLLQDADRRLAVQNQKFEVQLQAVKERLDQARGERRQLSVGCALAYVPGPAMQLKRRRLARRSTLAGSPSRCGEVAGTRPR